MSTTSERRSELIGGLVRGYADAVDALAASDDPEARGLAAQAFRAAAVADALGEALSTRAPFGALASSPPFVGASRRVAGSLWHRSVGWHSGNGNLYGLVGVAWDARSVGRRPDGRGLPASWLAEVDYHGDGFGDALETTTTIFRLVHHGRSSAVEAWRSVLGTTVSA
jgi:hypothetical protein